MFTRQPRILGKNWPLLFPFEAPLRMYPSDYAKWHWCQAPIENVHVAFASVPTRYGNPKYLRGSEICLRPCSSHMFVTSCQIWATFDKAGLCFLVLAKSGPNDSNKNSLEHL